jgi:small subunit ribosomal protein S16
MDKREARDGKAIEEIGFYDPIEKDEANALRVDGERAKYWLGVGAQPSDTVRTLLRRAGVIEAASASEAAGKSGA